MNKTRVAKGRSIRIPRGQNEHDIASFFKCLVADAAKQRQHCDYFTIGQELGRHTERLLGGDDLDEKTRTHFYLLALDLHREGFEPIWAWYLDKFPEYIALIPRKQQQRFKDGLEHYMGDELALYLQYEFSE